MQKIATSRELGPAFEKHAQGTTVHVQTLEKIFALLGAKTVAQKCKVMEGLLEEANSIISDTNKGYPCWPA